MRAQSRRLFVFIFIFFLMAGGRVFAGEFAGLSPGSSVKAEADLVLGNPVKEVEKGVRYDYNPAPYDAKRISLVFDKKSKVIESIDLYFKGECRKDPLVSWLELGSPVLCRLEKGRWVEYYHGVALYFKGKDDRSPVEFFSHFGKPQEAGQAAASSFVDEEMTSRGTAVTEVGHKTGAVKAVPKKSQAVVPASESLAKIIQMFRDTFSDEEGA